MEMVGDFVIEIQQDNIDLLLVYSIYVETVLGFSEKQSFFSLQKP